MNALGLPLLFFVQSLLGFILAPIGMIYADHGRPLDQVIAHMNHLYRLPSPQVLFIGDPEYATPTVSALYVQEADFLNQMRDELRKRNGFYGLVIIQAGTNYPTRLSQLMQWGNTLLKEKGWVLLWNPTEDRYEAAFKKEPS